MSDAHEIIIIKRHGDHEDDHHGGAWKIALADFMTAMMALFLVMWLINSTSKEQKQTIAEYFNPVKLAEVTHDRKGLADPHDTPAGSEGEGKEKGAEKGDAAGGRPDAAGAPGSRGREAALFQDPYAVLARLADEQADRAAAVASADAVGEDGQPGISGGEAGRDPFDPLYWQVAPLPRQRTDAPGAVTTAEPPPKERRLDARAPVAPAGRSPATDASRPDAPPVALQQAMRAAGVRLASAEPMPVPAPESVAPPEAPKAEAEAAKPEAGTHAKAEPVKDIVRPAPEAAPTRDAAPARPEADAPEADAIKAEIARAVRPLAAGTPAPAVEVSRTREGILISVTDEIDFSMFGIGSAEPTPKVVRALERIAKVLSARPGRIVLRGHTDARPFRSETYDNWRLSSARAQMASYMLVRGGIDEGRIERIEGYADRQPRNAADPKAAENRRIEILLRSRPE